MDDGAQPTIAVTGSGVASRSPDIVEISVGVSVLRNTVAAATDEAATLASNLVAVLRSRGLDDQDLQTTNYSISTEYDHRNKPPRPTGYRVDNTLRITVRDLEAFPTIVAEATAAGGDASTINGIRFSHADRKQLRLEARAAAWQDALASATQLAELAGRTLGPVHRVVEGGQTARPSAPVVARAAMAEGAMPIEAGTVDEAVSLSVVFTVT